MGAGGQRLAQPVKPCSSPKLTASALLARLTSKKFTLPAYLWAAFPILLLVEFAVFGQASETVINNSIQTRIVGRGMAWVRPRPRAGRQTRIRGS